LSGGLDNMTDHDDDTRLDAALEALARPEPPSDHVAQVLARTASAPASSLRLRWILPVAATVLVALGATWQMNRQVEHWFDAEMAGSESLPYRPQAWGPPADIDRPVLPPQAYWGMDAFVEFETLRPETGTQEHRNAGTQGRDSGRQGRRGAAGDELAWVPVTSGLPPIELESIEPVPLSVAPVPPLEVIALAEIPLAPIVVGPLTEEERP
jgi:hypothetical protein